MDVGYARMSSEKQDLTRHIDELTAAGCDQIVTEKASGKHGASRPEWERLIELTVVELSRLGRSTTQLTALLRDFEERSIGLRADLG
ncbi:recombinase family protein [Paenarthrobacter nitroguajacolicus]